MRMKSGMQGLDELIEGGLIKNRTYLVSGPPGSGRTTFGIQFLIQGALENENGLFLSLTETPTNVIKDMSRFKFGIVDQIKAKKIFFMDGRHEVFEDQKKKTQIDEAEIFDLSAGHTTSKGIFDKLEPIILKTTIKRLVIDSTYALSMLGKTREDGAKQVAKYINTIKQMEVTVLLISELDNINDIKFEHYLSDGIFYLHHFPDEAELNMTRAIQILKMRGTMHDSFLHPIKFHETGLMVLPNKGGDSQRKAKV